MPLTLDSLLDATHLLTFVIGAAVGAAGTYMADKATDKRRDRQKIDDRIARFRAMRKEMPELFTEMTADLGQPDHKHIREFVLIRSETLSFNAGEPVLCYYENKHRGLKAKVALLVDEGFVLDVTSTNVPRYRMLTDFAVLLVTEKP